jgi:hypothetical protein
MPLPFTVRRTDPDAAAFCARSGASDRAAVSAFVRGVKDLGLWESMVCWPLRSEQNAGTGTTAYSLGGLGTFDGTLTNGPTWGVDGVTFDDDTVERIETTLQQTSTESFTCAAVISCNAEGSSPNVMAATRNTATGRTGFTMPQSWFGQGAGGIIWNTSSPTDSVALEAAITNGSFQTYFIGGNFVDSLAASYVARNGAAKTLGPARALDRGGTPNILVIGNQGVIGTASLGGNMAFFAYFRNGYDLLTAPFYNLYRATLGTGLGLP